MRAGRLAELGAAGCTAARRVLILSVAAGVVAAAGGAGCGGVAAAVAHHPLRVDGRVLPGSRATLAHAPAGLRAAVRRTLGVRADAGSVFQQAELAANGGTAGDSLGYSVAISGSTAVVGAPFKNASAGAAYVFVRSGKAWSQQAELTAADGASADHFGYSVAVSGSTAVVGAPSRNSSTGSAYVFVRSGKAWSQQAELTAAGGVPNDEFGWSVAVSGSTAVAGAPGWSSGTGAAYVFARSGTAWSEQAGLTAAGGESSDEFGYSVAVAGSTAVVGDPFRNSSTGAAYVFTGSGTAWSQQAELTAADGASGDELGWSVAVFGSTAVAGAPGKNSNTGAAYVFTRSGAAWRQRAELTAADGASGDKLGWSVAVSGSTAVAGAPVRNSNTGAAYVFAHSGAAWRQRAELTAADGASGDELGWSVAVSGSTAVAGAPYKNSNAGAAYVFVLPSQQAELVTDGAAGDLFGWSVAVSGPTAVVGVPDKNSSAGAVYVFASFDNSWSLQTELTAADGVPGDEFGYSVAIVGSNAIVVGAPDRSSSTGAAYVFTGSGTAWSQQAELTAAGGAPNDEFGYSVAISGTTAVIGAPGHNSNTGAAYVFARSGTAWRQHAKLTATDGFPGDDFGWSVAISASTAVAGAPGKNSTIGAAYVFTGSGRAWTQQAELTAAPGAPGDFFGFSVAISGSTTVVGAPLRNSSMGAAYVFTRSGTAWSQQAELTAADGASGDHYGAAVAISGTTAVVGAPGHISSMGAAYVFARSGTSWSQQAELTAADGASGDDYGAAVAISGSTVVVGAPNRNSSTGAAYVLANL